MCGRFGELDFAQCLMCGIEKSVCRVSSLECQGRYPAYLYCDAANKTLAIWRAVFLPQTAVMAFGLGRNTLCGKAVRHGRASVLALYYSCTAVSA